MPEFPDDWGDDGITGYRCDLCGVWVEVIVV